MADELRSWSMQAFVCAPLGNLRLTRVACSKRHKSATTEYGPRNAGKVFSEVCSSCALGAAHLRGEKPSSWADGKKVVVIELVPVQAPPSVLIPAGALLRSEAARRHKKAARVDFR